MKITYFLYVPPSQCTGSWGLTWAALDTGGPEVVLPVRVLDQHVLVGVVELEAGAGVLTRAVILEVTARLTHKNNSP